MKYLLILDSIERSGIFLFMLNICYNTVQNQLPVYVHAFSWNKRTRLRPKVNIDDMHREFNICLVPMYPNKVCIYPYIKLLLPTFPMIFELSINQC